MMITGWKNIEKYTGYSRYTLNGLIKRERFPIRFIAGKPSTTQRAIENWFCKGLEKAKK